MRFAQVLPLLFASLLAGTLHAQPSGDVPRLVITATAIPSAPEIVRRAVANDELRRQHRAALECDQIITTERLDASDTVFKSKTVRIVYREGDDPAYAADLDVPRDGDTAKAEHRMAVMNLRRLAPRFQYALAGEDRVRGRVCYIIAYSPRGGQSAESREEKVINNLRGRYWVDKTTFEILRGEGSLASPVTVGLVAAVTRMDFQFHTQTLPGGEAGPADFSVDLTVKAPLYFYRQQQTSRLESWRTK